MRHFHLNLLAIAKPQRAKEIVEVAQLRPTVRLDGDLCERPNLEVEEDAVVMSPEAKMRDDKLRGRSIVEPLILQAARHIRSHVHHLAR